MTQKMNEVFKTIWDQAELQLLNSKKTPTFNHIKLSETSELIS